MPTTPRYTANVSADYAFAGVRTQPTLGASLRYIGDRWVSFDNNAGFPQYNLPSYGVVDLRAGVVLDPVRLQLYIRNLSNKLGQTSGYTWQGNPRPDILQPRTVGITATTRF